jgi:hypothetical protein
MRITTCLQAEGAGEAGTLTKTSSTLRNPHLRWTAEIARQAFVSPPGMTDRFERSADVVTALIVSGSDIVSYASEHVQNELCCCPFMI